MVIENSLQGDRGCPWGNSTVTSIIRHALCQTSHMNRLFSLYEIASFLTKLERLVIPDIVRIMDVHSAEIRSRNMRAIASSNTRPEIRVRSMLHRLGARFRLKSALPENRMPYHLWSVAVPQRELLGLGAPLFEPAD